MHPRIVSLSKRWTGWPSWARQLSVGLVYSAAYLCARELSFHHWWLPAGLQLLAVLIAPYRYWLALLVADGLTGIYAIISCEYSFGWVWKGLMLFPRDLFIMPFVALARSKQWLPYPLQLEKTSTIIALTVLIVAAALLIPLWIYFIDHFHQDPPGPSREEWLRREILGNYLGMLTLVPIGLFLVERPRWLRRHKAISEIRANLCLVLLLYLFMRYSHSALWSFGLRACLLLPMGWAALRLGWGGAAVIGAAASMALASLSSESYDPLTMEMEFIIGLCLTLFLLLGARIDQLHASARHEKTENRHHLEAGRQLQKYAEQRFQQLGGWMSEIAGPALTPPQEVRRYLDHVLPATEALTLHNQRLAGQMKFRRLGQDLAQPPLRLDDSEVEPFQDLAGLFRQEGICFQGHLRGSLVDLPPLAYNAVCRLISDAAVYLVSRPETYLRLDLRVRRIHRHGVCAIAIRMRASRQPLLVDPQHREAQLKRMRQISSTGLEPAGLAHLARLYHGRVRHRRLDAGKAQCIQLVLNMRPHLETG